MQQTWSSDKEARKGEEEEETTGNWVGTNGCFDRINEKGKKELESCTRRSKIKELRVKKKKGKGRCELLTTRDKEAVDDGT